MTQQFHSKESAHMLKDHVQRMIAVPIIAKKKKKDRPKHPSLGKWISYSILKQQTITQYLK